jgi:hypothetical protein
MLAGATFVTTTLMGQSTDPLTCIKELKEGTLIIRFPTNKPKVDTLTAMIARASDPKNKERLQKELQQTIEERDSLFADYVEAFKLYYDFSRVAYYYDYDGKDLNTAKYYNLDGERVAIGDLSEKPIFYVLFERTDEAKLDALNIYNRSLKKIPKPFPNQFTTGGINFLFLQLSDNKLPFWRVKKMNKRFHLFYSDVIASEK